MKDGWIYRPPKVRSFCLKFGGCGTGLESIAWATLWRCVVLCCVPSCRSQSAAAFPGARCVHVCVCLSAGFVPSLFRITRPFIRGYLGLILISPFNLLISLILQDKFFNEFTCYLIQRSSCNVSHTILWSSSSCNLGAVSEIPVFCVCFFKKAILRVFLSCISIPDPVCSSRSVTSVISWSGWQGSGVLGGARLSCWRTSRFPIKSI